jgi:queuine/archaeosine tRNA-ribosyltransferase
VVAEKVNDTITAARMFYAEMPSNLQERAMPVVQGHTFEQVNQCLETYRGLAVKYIGFGSFGTNGSNSNVNVADQRSAANLAHIVAELQDQDIRLHTFGMSTPPVIYAFKKLGIYSFDSLAWQRSAGFGKIYMPFTRAYNVSHRSTRNSALSYEEFALIKERTGHQCPFCEDFRALSENRLYRSLHNLVAVIETVKSERLHDQHFIASHIAWKSERYYKLFAGIYSD